MAQLAKASDCGSEDRGFESHYPPHNPRSKDLGFFPSHRNPSTGSSDAVDFFSVLSPNAWNFVHRKGTSCGRFFAQIAVFPGDFCGNPGVMRHFHSVFHSCGFLYPIFRGISVFSPGILSTKRENSVDNLPVKWIEKKPAQLKFCTGFCREPRRAIRAQYGTDRDAS